jgi:hypothetical protein
MDIESDAVIVLLQLPLGIIPFRNLVIMMFTRSTLAVLLTLSSLSLGANKRATPATFRLHGYDRGFGGRPLFFADGKLRDLQPFSRTQQ